MSTNRAREGRSSLTIAVASEVRGATSARRITQTQIARKLGRSQAYVSERMNAGAAFDLDDVSGIAELLGKDPFEFLISMARRARDEAEAMSFREERIAREIVQNEREKRTNRVTNPSGGRRSQTG